MTTGTALMWMLPLLALQMIQQATPGDTMESIRNVTPFGLAAACVVALWQDRKAAAAERRADQKAQEEIIANLSAHIASSTEVQRNMTTELASLGGIIRESSDTRHLLVDALRQLNEESQNQPPARRRRKP